mmetsp:Transcript_7715/g.31264  ORF Transcript_7715/g.31264 Transcript_7715/m.31264 type:complete len:219 (-) Transcript_7715:189-845(-)
MRADRSARSRGPFPRSSPLRTMCAENPDFAAASARIFSALAKPSRLPGWPEFSPTGSFSPRATSCSFFGGLFCSTNGAFSLRLMPTRESITTLFASEPTNGRSCSASSACVAPHSAQKTTCFAALSASPASLGSTSFAFTSSGAGAYIRFSTTSSGMSSGQYPSWASWLTTSVTFEPPYALTARPATSLPVGVVAPAMTMGPSTDAVTTRERWARTRG